MSEKITGPDDSDDVMARLRAADPAARANLDLDQAWSTVRDRAAQPGGAVVDDLAAARARRNKTWLVRVASVAAGALVFGGGGYAVGHAAGDVPHSQGSATLAGKGNPGATGAAGTGAFTPAMAPAPGPGLQSSTSGAQPSMPDVAFGYWGGRRTFQAAGLASAAGTAQGWTYNPGSVFSKESAAKIAAALGVRGPVTSVNGAWTVGAADGSGPSVMIQPDGRSSLGFYDPSKDPFACRTGTGTGSGIGSGTSTGTGTGIAKGSPAAGPAGTVPEKTAPTAAIGQPVPPPDCVPGDVAPAPKGDAAIAAAKAVLTSLGVDIGSLAFEATDVGQGALAYVSAFQLVNGARTGTSWGLSLAAAGVQSLNGWLAPLVSLGTYDVVSEQEAVARLGDPRFGAGFAGGMAVDAGRGKVALPPMLAVPTVAPSGAAGGSTAAPATPTVPPLLTAGSAISWPLDTVTIVKAQLGLALYNQTDGAATLLPTYQLSSADGRVWSMIALADRHLDFATR